MDVSALGLSGTGAVGALGAGGTVGTTAAGGAAAAGLGGQDFLKLLITQLTNQDPLEPTSNDDLLRQIASLREIELSSGLTDSLKTLTGQQRFASASSLIGQYVVGQSSEGSLPVSGVVSAVRFDTNGGAVLELEDGTELPLDRLGTVMSASRAGENFVGKLVTGVDTSRANDPRVIEGIVTAVNTRDGGEVVFDLDTGAELNLSNVVSVRSADESVSTSP